MNLAEAKLGNLRSHEEHVRDMEKGGEELLELYSEIVPAQIADLSPAE